MRLVTSVTAVQPRHLLHCSAATSPSSLQCSHVDTSSFEVHRWTAGSQPCIFCTPLHPVNTPAPLHPVNTPTPLHLVICAVLAQASGRGVRHRRRHRGGAAEQRRGLQR